MPLDYSMFLPEKVSIKKSYAFLKLLFVKCYGVTLLYMMYVCTHLFHVFLLNTIYIIVLKAQG